MILQINPSRLYGDILEANEEEMNVLKFAMKVKTDNFFFHPLYKKRLGDGSINFMNGCKIPFGLGYEVKKICKANNFECKLKGLSQVVDTKFDELDFREWVDKFFKDSEIKPRDYQIDTAIQILTMRRSIAELATSAGKTLIMFIVFAFLKNKNKANKFMVIVPRVSLIEQTLEEFIDYNSNENINVKFKIKMLFGGEKKTINETDNLFIGTFQTLSKMDKEFFETIDVVCVDESHFAQTNSIQKIFEKMVNTHFRFGVSGTTKIKEKPTANSYTILAHLGPLCAKIKSKELSDSGYISKIHINIERLNYLSQEYREKLSFRKRQLSNEGKELELFNLERKIARTSKERFYYIVDKIKEKNTNSLALFTDVQGKYGKNFYEQLKKELPSNFNVFYIDGSTKQSTRTEIQKLMADTETVSVLVASFGTLSTGVNIPNLHNLFLLESTKSETTILQSLGRVMRLHKNKNNVDVFDFVDDFRCKGYKNYLGKHGESRMELYKQEKISYRVHDVQLR